MNATDNSHYDIEADNEQKESKSNMKGVLIALSLLLVTGAAAFGVYRWLTYENTANFANFMRRDAQAPSPDQSSLVTISIDESIKGSKDNDLSLLLMHHLEDGKHQILIERPYKAEQALYNDLTNNILVEKNAETCQPKTSKTFGTMCYCIKNNYGKYDIYKYEPASLDRLLASGLERCDYSFNSGNKDLDIIMYAKNNNLFYNIISNGSNTELNFDEAIGRPVWVDDAMFFVKPDGIYMKPKRGAITDQFKVFGAVDIENFEITSDRKFMLVRYIDKGYLDFLNLKNKTIRRLKLVDSFKVINAFLSKNETSIYIHQKTDLPFPLPELISVHLDSFMSATDNVGCTMLDFPEDATDIAVYHEESA